MGCLVVCLLYSRDVIGDNRSACGPWIITNTVTALLVALPYMVCCLLSLVLLQVWLEQWHDAALAAAGRQEQRGC
jgi:hypothetical protein